MKIKPLKERHVNQATCQTATVTTPQQFNIQNLQNLKVLNTSSLKQNTNSQFVILNPNGQTQPISSLSVSFFFVEFVINPTGPFQALTFFV